MESTRYFNGSGCCSAWTPCQIEKAPPTLNSSSATIIDQKYATFPCPIGWSSSSGCCACFIPSSSSNWLPQSAKLCSASASKAPLPVKKAAADLASAMPKFPPSAVSTALSEPDWCPPPGETSAVVSTSFMPAMTRALSIRHLVCVVLHPGRIGLQELLQELPGVVHGNAAVRSEQAGLVLQE